MTSIKERGIDLDYSIKRLKQDRFIRHEEEQNKRLQGNLSFEKRMSQQKDEHIESLEDELNKKEDELNKKEDKLNKKEKIVKGYKSDFNKLVNFFKNYFVKDLALKILIKNNEQIDDEQINKKITIIKNNNEIRNQVTEDFHSVLNQFFYEKKKYSDIELSIQKYSSNENLSSNEKDKLNKSKDFLRNQLIKNEAYENTIEEMSKKWNKNEETFSFDYLKELIDKKIIKLTNDQNFLNSLEEKIEETVDKKDDKKAKMNKI